MNLNNPVVLFMLIGSVLLLLFFASYSNQEKNFRPPATSRAVATSSTSDFGGLDDEEPLLDEEGLIPEENTKNSGNTDASFTLLPSSTSLLSANQEITSASGSTGRTAGSDTIDSEGQQKPVQPLWFPLAYGLKFSQIAHERFFKKTKNRGASSPADTSAKPSVK